MTSEAHICIKYTVNPSSLYNLNGQELPYVTRVLWETQYYFGFAFFCLPSLVIGKRLYRKIYDHQTGYCLIQDIHNSQLTVTHTYT